MKNMTNYPFGFDIPEDSAGFLLWQATTLWQRRIRKSLEPYELSHAQFVIMAILRWSYGQKEEVAQIDIIERSKLDKMTVSKAVKKLVQRKLVERAEHKEDSRAKTVFLTPSGIALIEQVVPLVEGIDAAFFGSLGKREEKELLAILQRLIAMAS